jgi:hypothetical protein
MVNAVLLATLVKPTARWMVARWRRRAREYPASAIAIPVQELIETALIEELASPAADLQSSAEIAEEVAGRSLARTLLIAGAVAAVVAVSTLAVAALIRRRREAQSSEWVAVPVDAPVEEAEEAVAQESSID